jgi:hypothetical protein
MQAYTQPMDIACRVTVSVQLLHMVHARNQANLPFMPTWQVTYPFSEALSAAVTDKCTRLPTTGLQHPQVLHYRLCMQSTGTFVSDVHWVLA